MSKEEIEMRIVEWNELPEHMQISEVKRYYDILKKKQVELVLKRMFDVFFSLVLLVILSPIMVILAIWIKLDSEGSVFFRQERVTTYGNLFYIHKFRTMISDAEKIGSQITLKEDTRITTLGKKLRKYRLDELPQLIDILKGDMSFVGTRPEVPKYVQNYTNEMKATLLLPAGLTSEASIRYKDEAAVLNDEKNVQKKYIEDILPKKMEWNLYSLEHFSLKRDIQIMIKTAIEVLK